MPVVASRSVQTLPFSSKSGSATKGEFSRAFKCFGERRDLRIGSGAYSMELTRLLLIRTSRKKGHEPFPRVSIEQAERKHSILHYPHLTPITHQRLAVGDQQKAMNHTSSPWISKTHVIPRPCMFSLSLDRFQWRLR